MGMRCRPPGGAGRALQKMGIWTRNVKVRCHWDVEMQAEEENSRQRALSEPSPEGGTISQVQDGRGRGLGPCYLPPE